MRHRLIGLVTGLALVIAPYLGAQGSPTVGSFELRPFVGAFIPTGGMRNDLRDGTLLGMQGGFEFNENMHFLLGGFWSRNRTHFRTLPSRTADIWQFDAGGEMNSIHSMGRDWLFRPFVGAGAGLRTYDYEALGAKRCAAGYASVGAEAQRFEGAIRFELRDHVSCFKSPVNDSNNTRNDLGMTFGFVYHM